MSCVVFYVSIETMETNRVRSIIRKSFWKFAKTMPHIPHFYTLREKAELDEEFVFLVEFIRRYGYDEPWGRRIHRYLDLDGWKYWTMGARVESTTVINRARLGRHPEPIVLNPIPFRPTLDCHEFFCPRLRRMIPRPSENQFDQGNEGAE